MENFDPECLNSNIFESYSAILQERFSDAVDQIINGADGFKLRNELIRPCREYHKAWDFYCAQEAWTYAIPHSDTLSLYGLSEEHVQIEEWKMEVSCFPLYFGWYVYIEIRNIGKHPLPFTGTGYKSQFLHLSQFAEGRTVYDYLNYLFEPYLDQDRQMEMF